LSPAIALAVTCPDGQPPPPRRAPLAAAAPRRSTLATWPDPASSPIIERQPAPIAGAVGAALRWPGRSPGGPVEQLLAEVDDEHLVGAARRSPPSPRADPARGDVSDDRRARPRRSRSP